MIKINYHFFLFLKWCNVHKVFVLSIKYNYATEFLSTYFSREHFPHVVYYRVLDSFDWEVMTLVQCTTNLYAGQFRIFRFWYDSKKKITGFQIILSKYSTDLDELHVNKSDLISVFLSATYVCYRVTSCPGKLKIEATRPFFYNKKMYSFF